MKPEEWIVNGEVGISSKTLWAFFMGVRPSRNQRNYHSFGIPHDTDDWQRCWKLLTLFPEWRARLHEVGEWSPEWKPIVDKWEELEKLWNGSTLPNVWGLRRDLAVKERHVSEKMYKILRECEREGIREMERMGILKIEHMSDSGWSLRYL